jgi:RHS repeat-associated protein
MLILTYTAMALFFAAWAICGASIIWMIVFSIRLLFQFSDSKDAFSRRTLWNPLNAIINPRVLSDEGLKSRRRVLQGCLVFLACTWRRHCNRDSVAELNTYTWNARNRLTAITQGGTTQMSYAYDAMGRRTSKAVQGGTPTQFLYDGQNAVQEIVGSTINPILVGLGVDERFARNDTTGRTYFLSDAINSTIALTSAAGAIQNTYSYDPYGNTTQSNASFTNPYQYTGREADTPGLYYYRARYYSPGMGGFISEDPARAAGGQPSYYAYVGNNPLSNIDPMGLEFFGKCLAQQYLKEYGTNAWSQARQDRNTQSMPATPGSPMEALRNAENYLYSYQELPTTIAGSKTLALANTFILSVGYGDAKFYGGQSGLVHGWANDPPDLDQLEASMEGTQDAQNGAGTPSSCGCN